MISDRRKYRLCTAAVVLVSIVCTLCFHSSAHGSEKAQDGEVLVRVNAGAITEAELDRYIRAFILDDEALSEWDAMFESERKAFQGEVLQMMIDRKLMLAAAREKFAKRRIDAALAENLDRALSDMERQAGSRLGLIKSLHESGLTLKEWKQMQSETSLIQLYVGEETSAVHVRPAEMKEYYRRNQDAFRVEERIYYRIMYLAPRTGESKGDVRQRAEQIRELLQRGHSFEELARIYCFRYDETENGLLVREDRPEWLSGLEPGEVSGVIEGSGSVHLLAKLENITSAGVLDFREVQEAIRNRLMQEKLIEAQNELTRRLREEADIEFTAEGKKLVEDVTDSDFMQLNF